LYSIVNQEDINTLIATNQVFALINDQYGPPPNWSRPQGFISLSKIILEQQVSLASANAHFIRLHNYLKAFTPEEMVALSDEEMRSCQISRQKSTYLRALSKAILNSEIGFEELPHLGQEKVRQILTDIKGIGNWTTDIYMMFCLQAKDIFPSGDIAAINTISELFNVRSKEEILLLTEKWKPVRSLAAFYLWYYYLRKRNRTTIINPE